MGAIVNPAASIILVLICLGFGGTSEAEELAFNWTVEYRNWSPDCANVGNTKVITINGSFPGPTIRAHVGDTIVVNLTNNLNTGEGVVIHWHGIQQRGTPWADGTASISQCPIQPGKSFEYRLKVEKPGTFFYHGHYGMQRSAGLYGSLIVDIPNGREKSYLKYDDEFSLLLSDWWHKSVKDQERDLSSRNFTWIGDPQAILMNGRGQSDCSWEALYDHSYSPSSSRRSCIFTDDENCSPLLLKVLPNKTYRLRLASSTALTSLNFQIRNHKLTVVEADGNYVQPFDVDDMDINSGESYSVLFTTDQNPSQNYWISLSVRGRKPNTTQANALLNYITTPSTQLPTLPPPNIVPHRSDDQHSKNFSSMIKARETDSEMKPPSRSDRHIVLLNTQNYVNGFVKWSINNISLGLPEDSSVLQSFKKGLKGVFDDKSPPDILPVDYDLRKPAPNPNATNAARVYKLGFNIVVDVVLQNANALAANVSETHPWHLHGHDFWVLGYGEGKFIREKHEKMFNLKNPPLRNTVVVYPYGWTALRFVADNPGVWAFHCHIEPHLHMGMGVVFAEAVDKIGDVPPEALVCGTEAGYQSIGPAPSEAIAGGTEKLRTSPFLLLSSLAFIFIIYPMQ